LVFRFLLCRTATRRQAQSGVKTPLWFFVFCFAERQLDKDQSGVKTPQSKTEAARPPGTD
jgi:hypothetical protein